MLDKESDSDAGLNIEEAHVVSATTEFSRLGSYASYINELHSDEPSFAGRDILNDIIIALSRSHKDLKNLGVED